MFVIAHIGDGDVILFHSYARRFFRLRFVSKTPRNFCYCDTANTLCCYVSDHVDSFLNQTGSVYIRITR